MTWEQAVDALTAKGKAGRLPYLCSDSNPDVESREGYRVLAVRKATGQETAHPSPGQIVRNVVSAGVRAAKAYARGDHVWTPPNVAEAREATCETCEHLNNGRCRLCGCFVKAKARLATESCPDGRWGPVASLAGPSSEEK